MIYDLCQFTQDFLGFLNKKPICSEHENMLKTNADKEKEEKVINPLLLIYVFFVENSSRYRKSCYCGNRRRN